MKHPEGIIESLQVIGGTSLIDNLEEEFDSRKFRITVLANFSHNGYSDLEKQLEALRQLIIYSHKLDKLSDTYYYCEIAKN